MVKPFERAARDNDIFQQDQVQHGIKWIAEIHTCPQ